MNQVIDLQAKREEREQERVAVLCWTCDCASRGQHMYVLKDGIQCVDCDGFTPWAEVLDGEVAGR